MTEVNDLLVVAVLVVLLGSTGVGSETHPAIGESASPILTATAMPATNSKRYNSDNRQRATNASILTRIWSCQW